MGGFHVTPAGKDDPEHDLTESGRFCWCQPEIVQPCPACDVRLDLCPDDETRDNPAELSIFKTAREMASPQCQRCSGFGVVKAFDATKPLIIIHR